MAKSEISILSSMDALNNHSIQALIDHHNYLAEQSEGNESVKGFSNKMAACTKCYELAVAFLKTDAGKLAKKAQQDADAETVKDTKAQARAERKNKQEEADAKAIQVRTERREAREKSELEAEKKRIQKRFERQEREDAAEEKRAEKAEARVDKETEREEAKAEADQKRADKAEARDEAKAEADKERAEKKEARDKERAEKAEAAAKAKADKPNRVSRANKLKGKKLTATLDSKAGINPRRAGSQGHISLQIIIDSGDSGITTEDAIKKGARIEDIIWDINIVPSRISVE